MTVTPKTKITHRGVFTTEFWMSLVLIVCASVLVAIGRIDAEQWMLVAGVNGAGYALSRGLAKSG